MQTPLDTHRLAELIRQKHGVLVQLRDLAGRQLTLIDEGDMTALLGLLATKQKLLAGIQQLERQLDPFRDQDPDSRIWRNPADREQASQMAAQCASMLEETMKLETQGETALSSRRDEAATRLQAASGASHARQAYLQARPPRTGRFDLCSE